MKVEFNSTILKVEANYPFCTGRWIKRCCRYGGGAYNIYLFRQLFCPKGVHFLHIGGSALQTKSSHFTLLNVTMYCTYLKTTVPS